MTSRIKVTYLPPLCRAPSFLQAFAYASTCLRPLQHLQRSLHAEEFHADHLAGFKMGDRDQIFSVWQPGQYGAPVIKPLPVTHPARIDEFPLGRAELSLELPAEGGILSTGQVLTGATAPAAQQEV